MFVLIIFKLKIKVILNETKWNEESKNVDLKNSEILHFVKNDIRKFEFYIFHYQLYITELT
ncbi:MAG: hypothetical protein A2X61_14780 [Ignavibacteria bacterium GWB2_35_12]|nr:MAG: hypothetical protein A2X63_06710 [Ignavibacteria bacterium GWA2_35_8]OGU38346.1 MAG: hypothetical protein A2X61_14780 [Ignavibacteria bacterium GWB2_35_12]OGU94206.1 MAG: hypothetical protein A2220_01735 [Ignavibacteria bacterium RIFOXYA2_FULL_35_10]OGV23418.1 MAG: hypothetical protein A2475_06475 [Ignavibacteria bacterium RIFOXYC2_FULL_35_21]